MRYLKSWREPKKTSETKLKQQIKAYLAFQGWFAWHSLQSLGAFKGVPDITAIKKGRVIFIEAKSKNGKLSEYQQRFKDNIEFQDGEYILCRSLDDLMERGI